MPRASNDRLSQIVRHLELVRDSVTDWSAYPFCIPAISNLERIEFHPQLTILVGENGSGKSTLIEAIAKKLGFNAEGGTKNFSASYRPSESSLHQHVRLARGSKREKAGFFLRAETMFNVSTEAESCASYGWDSLHEMSHGEAFLWLVMNRFRPDGLYILDEPEAALSPQRQLAPLGRMHQLISAGSQFIVATHSPILMAYPDARILSLDGGGIHRIAYEETEHYTVTRAFLHNPARMLNEIFAAVDRSEA